MTPSPISSAPFELNFRPQLAKSGLRNRPPESLPPSWGLSSTGLFDFSPDSGRLPPTTETPSDLEAPEPLPGTLYHPQGALRELATSRTGELIVSGPAGTGKSRACLERIYRLAREYPGMRALLLRKTRESLTQSGLVTLERFVLPRGAPWVMNQKRRVRQSYELPNGSELVCGGLDKTEKIFSTEYDIIYVMEAREIAEPEWEDLTTRLRFGPMPYQQIIGDTNPDAPSHWIKQRANRGQLRLIESRHEDNPVVWDEAEQAYTEAGATYIERLDNLTGVRHKRLRLGLWVAAEGVVYADWDPAVHLVEPFAIPSDWPRYLSIDFGYTNPFVCQWWAEDPDGRLVRYRELYGTQRLVEDWAHAIHEQSPGERISGVICDHDAEGRATLEAHLGHRAEACHGAQSGTRQFTTAAIKDVESGVEKVSKRLRVAGDGKPRLLLLRNALARRDELLVEAKRPTCTEEEIESYVWETVVSPKFGGEIRKEEPLKKDDHGMDAMRYMVMHFEDPRAAWAEAMGKSAAINYGTASAPHWAGPIGEEMERLDRRERQLTRGRR